DSGHVVVEEVVALLEREMHADARDHFRIVFATLKRAQQLGWKPRAAGQLRDALATAHRSDRHDARDDRNPDAGQLATFAEIVEVAVIEEELRDNVIRPGIDLRLEMIHFDQPVRSPW